MHPLLIAARLLVRDMGGAERAAEHLGKSGTTLSHELNPHDKTAKLGLLDAATLTAASGDTRIVAAFAAECGGVFLAMPAEGATVAGETTLLHAAKLADSLSKLLNEAAEAERDGTVDDHELRKVMAKGIDFQAAWQGLMVHMGRLNQAANDKRQPRVPA